MKTKHYIILVLAVMLSFSFTSCKKSPKMPIVTEIEDNGDGPYTLYDDYRLCKGSQSNFKTTQKRKTISYFDGCERCTQPWGNHDER